jgi:hypothetical protein
MRISSGSYESDLAQAALIHPGGETLREVSAFAVHFGFGLGPDGGEVNSASPLSHNIEGKQEDRMKQEAERDGREPKPVLL